MDARLKRDGSAMCFWEGRETGDRDDNFEHHIHTPVHKALMCALLVFVQDGSDDRANLLATIDSDVQAGKLVGSLSHLVRHIHRGGTIGTAAACHSPKV